MSKTKKILSVVLALALVFTLAIPTFALGFEEDDTEYSQTWTLGDAVEVADDTYTIDVSLTTNYPTGAVQFDLVLEGVDLVDAELGDDYPAAYCAEISCNADKDSAGYGRVMINPITDDYDSCDAEEIDGVIAVITVTGTSGSVTIDKAQKKTAEGGTLIAARLEPADVVVGKQIVGQLINPIEVEDPEHAGQTIIVEDDINVVNIGAADPADLEPTSAYATSGIIVDKNKTFGNKYDGVVYGFTLENISSALTAAFYTTRLQATNNGTIEVVGVKSGRVTNYGTGITVKVYNSDTTLSKTYVVVIFGDLNGDGKLTSQDTSACFDHVNGVEGKVFSDEVLVMAANTTVASGRNDAGKALSLYAVNANNTDAIFKAVNGVSTLDQAALAASHNTYNLYYQ